MSDGGVDGPADNRMLRLGSMVVRFSCDDRYGATFERRVGKLGIEQVRTPFRAPRGNAISERWVKSVGAECLDHLLSSTKLVCVSIASPTRAVRFNGAPVSNPQREDHRSEHPRRIASRLLARSMTDGISVPSGIRG